MSSASTAEAGPVRPQRADRLVLASNLLSGAFWLILFAALGMWPAAVLGAGYVVVASMVLAAISAQTLMRWQEIAVWVVVCLAAWVAWAWLFEAFDDNGDLLVGLCLGFVIGTLCLLAWQLLALALRHVHATSRRGRQDSSQP